MEMLEEKDAPSRMWEPVFVYWPRRAVNGPWLVLTEAERRRLPNGRYEYRAVPDDIYDWETAPKADEGGPGEDRAGP
jgi:hypothetical protein